LEGLFNTPNNLWEHQLREIFSQPEVKKDPLFQILTAVFQTTASMADVADMYRLLGLEDFTRLLHLLDGRTVKFPTSMDLKDTIILTLCYYYRKIEGLDWTQIHEILPFDFPSIAISRKISSLDEEIRKKISPFMTEDVMEETQDQARAMLEALEDKRFKNDALRAANTDPLGEMKQNLIQFFKDRTDIIRKGDHLRDSLYEKFLRKIEGDELTFDQMMSVWRLLGSDNNNSADGLLGVFRPVPGAQSLFLEVSKPVDKDEELKLAYKNYSAEELQTIEKTMGHLAILAKKGFVSEVGGAAEVDAEKAD
jgi:hypothetical protein